MHDVRVRKNGIYVQAQWIIDTVQQGSTLKDGTRVIL